MVNQVKTGLQTNRFKSEENLISILTLQHRPALAGCPVLTQHRPAAPCGLGVPSTDLLLPGLGPGPRQVKRSRSKWRRKRRKKPKRRKKRGPTTSVGSPPNICWIGFWFFGISDATRRRSKRAARQRASKRCRARRTDPRRVGVRVGSERGVGARQPVFG